MRNFASKLLGEVGVRAFSSVFIFLLAHELGAREFGLYSTGFAYASLFLIAVDLGMNAIVTREIARQAERRAAILRTANFIKFLAGAAAVGAIHALARFSAFARDHLLLVDTLGVMVVTYSLIDYMGAALAGKEEMGWEAALRALCRALVATCGILVLYSTRSLAAVTLSMSAASLLSLAVGVLILWKRFGGFPIGWDPAVAKRLMASSLPLLGSVVFWTFYDNQDILLLNHFRVPAQDIGLFWSASKVIDVLKVAPVLLAGAFFPALARFAAARESFLGASRRLLAYGLPFLIAIGGTAFYAAPWLEKFLYGAQFAGAAPLLRTLLVAFAAIFLNHLFMQILIAKDREGKLVPGAILACLSNLAFSWYWIPRRGALGACEALIASEFLYLAFQGRLILEAVPGLFNPFRRAFG